MSRLQLLQAARFGQEVERWLPPDVGDKPSAPEPEPVPEPQPEVDVPTPEEIAAIEEAARAAGTEAGFKSGYADGYQQGDAEGREQARQEAERERQAREVREAEWLAEQERTLRETVVALELVAKTLADPLAGTADELEPELLALVSTLARRVVMEELSLRPELVQSVLHQALARLPSRNHKIRVHLHPSDRAILEAYAESQGEQLTWLQDPTIERGGCRIESGPSRIDATLETRLRQSIEAVWGELQAPSDDAVVAHESSAEGSAHVAEVLELASEPPDPAADHPADEAPAPSIPALADGVAPADDLAPPDRTRLAQTPAPDADDSTPDEPESVDLAATVDALEPAP